MNRITFIKKLSIGLILGIPILSATSCSTDDDPAASMSSAETDDSCLQNGTSSSISTNHGHSLSVSRTDVENGTEKQYTIQGSSDHNHIAIVSSANFSSLKKGRSISITSSSGDNHTHKISVSCA